MADGTETAPESTFDSPPLAEIITRPESEGEPAPEVYPESAGWDATEIVRETSESISHPQVVATPAGEVHLIWSEAGWLWHMMRVSDAWTEPRRLFAGIQPSLAVDDNGDLHMVFVHDFEGRYQVYYARYREPLWTLPYEISRTPGVSHNPHVIVGPNNQVYAVWEDDTPGFPSIYHAYNPEGHWINAPVPGARGWRPSLACDGEKTIHLVWESAIPNQQGDDIYHSQLTASGWTLPENISDSPKTDSSLPQVAPAADGTIHVVWEERYAQRVAVGYTFGRYAAWHRPIGLTRPGRRHSPRIAVSQRGNVHVLWVSGNVLAYRERTTGEDARWQMPERIARAADGISHPRIVLDASDDVHVVWVAHQEGTRALCCRRRQTSHNHVSYLPTVMG